ncbi:uncharacterized protein METZ01_LOCUS144920 [marine metagenome]|uniref:Uncharacterized protein n=1 Tax=marine metagenome TaxID=408172 RepID=A0A381ZS55_9ZZZZ
MSTLAFNPYNPEIKNRFSNALKDGYRDALCPIYNENFLDEGSPGKISFPLILTFPEPIDVIDDKILRIVVLPEPFGPSKQTTAPDGTVKETLFNTVCR